MNPLMFAVLVVGLAGFAGWAAATMSKRLQQETERMNADDRPRSQCRCCPDCNLTPCDGEQTTGICDRRSCRCDDEPTADDDDDDARLEAVVDAVAKEAYADLAADES